MTRDGHSEQRLRRDQWAMHTWLSEGILSLVGATKLQTAFHPDTEATITTLTGLQRVSMVQRPKYVKN